MGRSDPEKDDYSQGWLLWLAVASVACLPPLNVPSFVALLVAAIFIAAWACVNISPKRLVSSMFLSSVEIFFREINARNAFKVPRLGEPTIFVCAPHMNQFVDPFVVMRAVGRNDLCYLTAAKTMRRRFLGAFARVLGAIPVERGQDNAFKGDGLVHLSAEDACTLQGRGTGFLRQVKNGDSISIQGTEVRVRDVLSDESLVLSAAASSAISHDWVEYKVTPKADQSMMYAASFDALADGKAIVIFPEGGSHDQPSLLPFKAGIAIMALGALAKNPNLPLKIVPVGINYFSGHRFRSRVFLDIGDPLDVPPEIQQEYALGGENKFGATSALMHLIETALGALTTSVPDYETLEFFWTLRRLNKTGDGPMSLAQQVEFTRRYTNGFDAVMPDGKRFKDTEQVQHARRMCSEYNKRLKEVGMRDYQVAHVMSHNSRSRAACLLLGRFLLLLVFVTCLVPMTLVWLPLVTLTRGIAFFKARQAVKDSTVKIFGRDVAATWKIIVALIVTPFLWLTYTWAAGALATYYQLEPPWPLEASLLTFFFLPMLSYASMLAGERLTLVARSLPPLLMLALRPSSSTELISLRQQLAEEMQGLVDDYGWRVDADKAEVIRRSMRKAPSAPDYHELLKSHTHAATEPHVHAEAEDSPRRCMATEPLLNRGSQDSRSWLRSPAPMRSIASPPRGSCAVS